TPFTGDRRPVPCVTHCPNIDSRNSVHSFPLTPHDLSTEWHRAVEYLGAMVSPGVVLHSGVGGRTLSGPVKAQTEDDAWLRLMSSSRPEGKIWEGPTSAESALPDAVPRPRLLAEHAWSTGGMFYRAHLWERVRGHTVSNTPVLGTDRKSTRLNSSHVS